MTTSSEPGRTGRVIVVGDLVTDVHATLANPLATGSDTPARIQFTPGGSAANTAAWLAAAGVPVTLVAAVGDDAAGTARVEELTAAGVHCAVRRCADAPTGTVVVLTDGHERSMLCDRGANALLSPGDVAAALRSLPDATHLHLSGYTLLDDGSRPAGMYALAAARDAGLTVSVDAASAQPLTRCGADRFLEWVRGVEVLLANADEARVLAEREAESPVAPGVLASRLASAVGLVVVKLGADGAVATAADTPPMAAPAIRVAAVDPTGAGDAFAAGFLSAWLAKGTTTEALAAGVRLGAQAVTTTGGRPLTPPTR